MTREIWTILSSAIESVQDAPLWLREQALLGWEAVSALPQLDVTTHGQHALPSVEQKLVTPDYLDFLREQITLDARDPEWRDLLRRRLAALEPFVGQELLVATFYCRPHSATLRIKPGSGAPVHLEVV